MIDTADLDHLGAQLLREMVLSLRRSKDRRQDGITARLPCGASVVDAMSAGFRPLVLSGRTGGASSISSAARRTCRMTYGGRVAL